jgi:hypothetical protein
VFVHEYVGDYRSWELQMRHFSRQHRCATYCLDGSVFLKRTVPTAARLLIPRAGHTINSEEQAAVNAALAKLLAAEAGRWLRARVRAQARAPPARLRSMTAIRSRPCGCATPRVGMPCRRRCGVSCGRWLQR